MAAFAGVIATMAACSAGGKLDQQPALSGPAGSAAPIAAVAPESFDVAAARQRDLVAEADVLRAELQALHSRGGWRERGYFTASESDALEGLLLRDRAIRAALWGNIDRLGGPDAARHRNDERPETHVLLAHAGWAVAVAKLNEAFYRSEIPARTYDRLALAYTSPERDANLAAAWQLHEKQLADATSALSRLRDSDRVAASLLSETATLHDRATGQLSEIRARSERGKLSEEIRHDRATELGHIGYASRALLFKDISRVKSPTTHLIRFSSAQKEQVHRLLEPGDVLLTYTASYISDVFIPGVFKHAITYVDTNGAHFKIVLYAEEDPDAGDHRAGIRTGEEAGRRLDIA